MVFVMRDYHESEQPRKERGNHNETLFREISEEPHSDCRGYAFPRRTQGKLNRVFLPSRDFQCPVLQQSQPITRDNLRIGEHRALPPLSGA